MNTKIKHRGPDGDGFFVDNKISLGHTRLAIIDLSERASQPMFSRDDSIVLIYNGEIYNFKEIKSELQKKGYEFRSESDSEVILGAYQEYGIDCIKKFNGIFAFAIWDKNKQELFLVRDRIGVKPLYYYWQDGKLIFSSEIKAILEHNIERKVNLKALNIYFRMLYVPGPITMFENINKLEPGSYLFYKDGKIETKKYWQPENFVDLKNRNEAVEKIQKLMKDSVKKQMIADRPVGVFLSGGIDSTIIAGLASEFSRDKIKTFSVGFDLKMDKFNSDFKLANETSQYFDTKHHEYIITGKDVAENLEKVVYHMDEPVSNTTEVAMYLLSKFTSEEVVVALGGDGGDELFGGYERYRLSQLISYYQKLPVIFRKSLGSLIISFFKSRRPALEKLNITTDVARYLSFLAQKESDTERFLLEGINDDQVTTSFYDRQFFQDKVEDHEKMFMWADLKAWLVDESLICTDKMSMAWGLEERVPILDHRLVELSLQIPSKWKLNRREGKFIFKQAMQDYLPPHVLSQPKRGWFSPTSHWLRTSLKELAHEVLSPTYSSAARSFFDFSAVNKMLDKHIKKEEYHMNLLWALITFQIWHRYFIENKR